MDGQQPLLRLAREESRISRRHPENETFGFLLEPLQGQAVEVALVHYLPAPPARLGSEFEGADPKAAVTGLRGKQEIVREARYFDIGIDPDDPLGRYRIEVFVNGSLEDIVTFEVVP